MHFSGFANLDESVKISKKSRFNIASNAKQFTALTILRLIEKNPLSIYDELGQFFPELQYTPAITIQQLLTHICGILDVYDFMETAVAYAGKQQIEGIICEGVLASWNQVAPQKTIVQYPI